MPHEMYRLTFSNGRCYIGISSRSAEVRFKDHMSSALHGVDYPVYRAWRKLGAPTMTVIGSYGSLEELYAAEVKEIAAGKDLYNVAPGGVWIPPKKRRRKKIYTGPSRRVGATKRLQSAKDNLKKSRALRGRKCRKKAKS